MMFSKDFKGTFTMKVYDAKQPEMGRAKTVVNSLKDAARFIDFRLAPPHNIDTDSKLTLE